MRAWLSGCTIQNRWPNKADAGAGKPMALNPRTNCGSRSRGMGVRWFSTTAEKGKRWSGQSQLQPLAKALPVAFKASTRADARWGQVRRLRSTSGHMIFALRTWAGLIRNGPRSSSSGGLQQPTPRVKMIPDPMGLVDRRAAKTLRTSGGKLLP